MSTAAAVILEVGFTPCATTDPEVFHSTEHAPLAKRLCRWCDLESICKTQARTDREWGTWGGETSAERADAGYAPFGWRGRTGTAAGEPVDSTAPATG